MGERAGILLDDDKKELLGNTEFEDTSSVKVPESLIDQVIGQEIGRAHV